MKMILVQEAEEHCRGSTDTLCLGGMASMCQQSVSVVATLIERTLIPLLVVHVLLLEYTIHKPPVVPAHFLRLDSAPVVQHRIASNSD